MARRSSSRSWRSRPRSGRPALGSPPSRPLIVYVALEAGTWAAGDPANNPLSLSNATRDSDGSSWKSAGHSVDLLDSPAMSAPKRFPDRDEIVEVREEAVALDLDTESAPSGGSPAASWLGARWQARLPRSRGSLGAHPAPLRRRVASAEIDVHLGDIVGVVGSPAKSRRGEPSLAVDELTTLAKNRNPLPDTFHGLTDAETRYRKRYLDLLMNEESRELFLLRTRVVSAIRRHLDEEGFVEVETPVLQPRYGGAFAHPFVTHSNELDADLYLRIATELYLKRLIVGGLERVYEIGKDFRNESVSYKHQPEFTMLEWYEAYADLPGHDGAHRGAGRAGRARGARHHRRDVSRARDRPEAPVEAHRASSSRSRRYELWTRDAGELRAWLDGARRRHGGGQGLAAARRPRLRPLRRAEPDRADDRPRTIPSSSPRSRATTDDDPR